MTTILRPLSTSELLDRAFHLYRNHFLMFMGIAAIPQVGVLALRLADSTLWFRQLIASRGVRIALLYLASFVAVEISHAATVVGVSNLHLGRSADIWSSYASARPSLLRVIGIALAAFLLPLILGVVVGIVAIAVSAVILAGLGLFSGGLGNVAALRIVAITIVVLATPLLSIRWWTRWSLVVPVTVLEGSGLRTALRRSRSLTQGHRWRIFVVYALVFVLTWTVSVLLQAPFYSMIQWRGFMRAARVSHNAAVVSAVGNFVSQSLVAPLLTIAFTLIYYDERVRKEGFDLQLIMASLEQAAQTTPALPSIS